MSDDSLFSKITREVRESVGEALESAGDHAERAGRSVLEKARALRSEIFGQHVTAYPAYAYRDAGEPAFWIAPMRVWVHDNRDTPGVEEMLERLVVAHFERDLGKALEPAEAARLEERMACFIADDKSNENVEFSFAGDPSGQWFRFAQPTTANGVIEESIRIPDELVRALTPNEPTADGSLKIHVRTTDGNGAGEGRIRFLAPRGLSIVSDIDDTVKITHVPAGKRTVLRNVFIKEWVAAAGMRERYEGLAAQARAAGEDVSFHYISGSPWQLYGLLSEFLIGQEHFPAGTFHMKNLRKNLLEAGALDSIRAFALGGDLATLDQKIRQITNLMIHLPQRQFILVGDSGEKDPEVYRAIQRLFPAQVRQIIIRDVLGERLAGMELITGPDVPVALDTTEVEKEMLALVAQARAEGGQEKL